MITSYEALMMGQYQEIDRLIHNSEDELDMQVGILAILSGLSEDELLRRPLAEYTDMAAKGAFLRKPIGVLAKVKRVYECGAYRLRPCENYRKLTAGQYIDFQAFTREGIDYCGLLSVLLVPEGKAYGEGYEVQAVRGAIEEAMPVPDGMALLAFFLKKYVGLIRDSLIFSERAARRVKDKGKRKEMQAEAERLRTLLQLAGAGLRT